MDETTAIGWKKDGKEYLIYNIPCRVNLNLPEGVQLSAECTLLVIRLQEIMEAGFIREEVNFKFFDDYFYEIFG